MHMIQIPLKCL